MAKKKRTAKAPDVDIESALVEGLITEVARHIRGLFKAGVSEHDLRRAYFAVEMDLETALIKKSLDQLPKRKDED